MRGKVVVVTGASSGIGLETARALAALGAQVVMVGRNRDKSQAALETVQASAPNPDQVELMLADFSRLGSVRELGTAITTRHGAIDVLVNNAGLYNPRRIVTEDGFEETFQVNHLAPFLLTGLLLDALRAVPAGRIVNVASSGHIGARLDFNDLQLVRGYRTFKAYGRSKLCNLYFTFELARRLQGGTVTVNALHPGFVATSIVRSYGWLADVATKAFGGFVASPAKGAATSIYLASAPDVAGVSGQYFIRCKQARPTATALETEPAKRLWDLSEQMTGYPYRSLLPAGVVGV